MLIDKFFSPSFFICVLIMWNNSKLEGHNKCKAEMMRLHLSKAIFWHCYNGVNTLRHSLWFACRFAYNRYGILVLDPSRYSVVSASGLMISSWVKATLQNLKAISRKFSIQSINDKRQETYCNLFLCMLQRVRQSTAFLPTAQGSLPFHLCYVAAISRCCVWGRQVGDGSSLV